eukprot:10464229-Alexandrium_andersonii.AAC.1
MKRDGKKHRAALKQLSNTDQAKIQSLVEKVFLGASEPDDVGSSGLDLSSEVEAVEDIAELELSPV